MLTRNSEPPDIGDIAVLLGVPDQPRVGPGEGQPQVGRQDLVTLIQVNNLLQAEYGADKIGFVTVKVDFVKN